jgi:hypothetical protein
MGIGLRHRQVTVDEPRGPVRARLESGDFEMGRPSGLRAAAIHLEERREEDLRRVMTALMESEMCLVGGLLGASGSPFQVVPSTDDSGEGILLVSLSAEARRMWGRVLLGALGVAEGMPWARRVVSILEKAGYVAGETRALGGESAVQVWTAW